MQNAYVAAIVAAAIAVLFLALRSGGRRPGDAARPELKPAAGGELIAVIAAAVAAATGMEVGSFRIASLSPSAPPRDQSGFNTPVWGHIDRNRLGE
jgi:hypothetical protein